MDCVEWEGPGVVIGQDGVMIFVRHGGTYVRIHRSRLILTPVKLLVLKGHSNLQKMTRVEILMYLLLTAMWTLTLLLTLWVTIIKMTNSHLTLEWEAPSY